MINTVGKTDKQGKSGVGREVSLAKVVRVVLMSSKGGQRTSHVAIGRKNIPGRKTASAKALRQEFSGVFKCVSVWL